MLYCIKCNAICDDGHEKCINCKSQKGLRPVNADDMVHLHRADQYTAKRLEEQFEVANITYKIEDFGLKSVSHLYDSEVMPTDKLIFVKFEDFEQAKVIASQIKAELDENQEAFEEVPKGKRIVVQIVSVAAFLLVVTVVVLAADNIAELVKAFFTR